MKKNMTGLVLIPAFTLLLAILLSCSSLQLAEAAPGFNIGDKVQVNASYLNVRANAGTQYGIIDGFNQGEITEVAGYYGDWLIVETHGGAYGYIYSTYVDNISRRTNVNRGSNLSGWTREDLYWLSRIVYSEAGAEPVEGQIAVANVVLNRLNHPDFPKTIWGVIFEYTGTIPQFSPVAEGTIYWEPSAQAVESARAALNGYNVVPDDTLYFFAPHKVHPQNWIWSRPVIKRIGDHVFAR